MTRELIGLGGFVCACVGGALATSWAWADAQGPVVAATVTLAALDFEEVDPRAPEWMDRLRPADQRAADAAWYGEAASWFVQWDVVEAALGELPAPLAATRCGPDHVDDVAAGLGAARVGLTDQIRVTLSRDCEGFEHEVLDAVVAVAKRSRAAHRRWRTDLRLDELDGAIDGVRTELAELRQEIPVDTSAARSAQRGVFLKRYAGVSLERVALEGLLGQPSSGQLLAAAHPTRERSRLQVEVVTRRVALADATALLGSEDPRALACAVRLADATGALAALGAVELATAERRLDALRQEEQDLLTRIKALDAGEVQRGPRVRYDAKWQSLHAHSAIRDDVWASAGHPSGDFRHMPDIASGRDTSHPVRRGITQVSAAERGPDTP